MGAGVLLSIQGLDAATARCIVIALFALLLLLAPLRGLTRSLGFARTIGCIHLLGLQALVGRRGASLTFLRVVLQLLLAQGAGRLIRTERDRGVVAVLDPRLSTAGYAGRLRASLPPLWPTTDRGQVLAALRRLSESLQSEGLDAEGLEPPGAAERR